MLTADQCADVWRQAGGDAFVAANNGAAVVVWRAASQRDYTLFTREQFFAGPCLTLDRASQEGMREATNGTADVVFCVLSPSPNEWLVRLLGDHWNATMHCWPWTPPAPLIRRSARLRGRSPVK